MPGAPRALRASLALLLLVSAILFAVGTSLEKGNEDDHDAADPAAALEEVGEESASEASGEEHEAAEATADAEEPTESEASEESEEIFGLNPESTPLIALAIALSVLLAIAVWLSDRWQVLATIAAFALVFAILDAREATALINRGNDGIAAIAIVLTILHLAISTGATLQLRRTLTQQAAT